MMGLMFNMARPILQAMDAETAHRLTLTALKCGLHPRVKPNHDPHLEQTLWGLHFINPVGICAGFDKNAEALDPVFSLGLGFTEAGTVTPRPQTGNPRPRVFRDIESGSVINRMGFPNAGMDVFDRNYQAFRRKGVHRHATIGINIGKNKDTEDPAADYLTLINRFAKIASYLTVNISSPNTPGLRSLQGRAVLLPLLNALVERRDTVCKQGHKTPLLVKLAPDLSEEECEDIAAVVLEAGIDGLVLTNTTLARPETLPDDFRAQTGGLSGPHVKAASTEIIKRFYKLTKGKLPIIGAGGIASGADAYEKIRAGASLLQIYTALVFQGPALIPQINDDLIRLLDRDKFSNIKQAIGVDAK